MNICGNTIFIHGSTSGIGLALAVGFRLGATPSSSAAAAAKSWSGSPQSTLAWTRSR
jgi:NAD(P)-dependent dehydrogenase (short-subunit alcohol dehydrogenase family)